MSKKTKDILSPSLVAKYFLLKSTLDGDLITQLKMQKLIYYAYVWIFIMTGQKLFQENIEAWPSGPVVPSLYRELKTYGSTPIGSEYVNAENENEFRGRLKGTPKKILGILDKVYAEYIIKTAFELVHLTHSESPWRNARISLEATDHGNIPISLDNIKKEYQDEKIPAGK